MKHSRILTATLTVLCASSLSLPVLAQSGGEGWNQSVRSASAARATQMRAGPERDYPLVRSIARGVPVTVHGCLDDRSWCDVTYGRDRGWVTAADLATRHDGREDVIANLSGRISIGTVTFSFGDYWENHYRQRPFYSERYRWEEYYHERYRTSWGPRTSRSYWGNRLTTGYMLRRSWMRAGPDHDYPALRRLASGTQVSVHGCLRDWSWCDVSYRRDRGWVPGRDVAVSYQGRRRSINTIAPYAGIVILSFSFGSYWDNYYRDRTFYRERDRWERQYQQTYRPNWGPRQDEGRDRDRDTDRDRDQDRIQPGRTDPQPAPRPQVQWQGQSQPQVPTLPQPRVQPLPPGYVHQPGQPAVQPPGRVQSQEQVREGQKPRDRKPQPGDPDYVRPGQVGPNP